MKSAKVVMCCFLIFLYTSLSLRLNLAGKEKNLREFLNYVFVGKTRTKSWMPHLVWIVENTKSQKS